MEKKCLDLPLEDFSEILKLVSVPYRLQIICLLFKKGPLCVCDIIKVLGIKQNLVSHHLKMLKRIQLIKSKRDGVKQIYSLNNQAYENIQSQIKIIFNI